MAKEPDQTRWVGIRPTDPSEDIPTTTKKQAPAIADLQAIKEIYYYQESAWGIDCSVEGTFHHENVVADEIWVITNIFMLNRTTICDKVVRTVIAVTGRDIETFYSIPAGVYTTWHGQIIITPGDHIQTLWQLGGANDNLRVDIHGYKIGVY